MAQEGARLSTDLFDRPKHSPISKFDIHQTLRTLARSLQDDHRTPHVAVILDLATELPETRVDGQQIKNVLFALFLRSQNAILESKRAYGTITVRTGVKGGKFQVSITDDGIVDLMRMTDAIFAEETRDNGLCLATCAEIVQDQAGELYAWRPRCAPFTTIIMDLPIEN
jgi:nitrogen fixation/metabolism regulation signal transduction histidine kinase